mgnify:CR=1 FL=1|jgi:hypothetical protein
MPKFFVDYTVTEFTHQRVVVEAETAEQALELMYEYEVDLSESWQIDSMKYEIDYVEITGTVAEDAKA